MSDERQEPEPPSGTSQVEWAVAGIGAAVVAATIGAMLYYGFSESGQHPVITFTTAGIEKVGDQYLVNFIARNDGDATAAALNVVGTLMDGEAVLEESEATFDYLPGNSQRSGGLFFLRDPAGHELRISSIGYARP